MRSISRPTSGNSAQTQWHSKPDAVRIATTLQQGGNVVFFRHAMTDMLATDQRPLNDCSKQRNLSIWYCYKQGDR
jgi:uncharacterized protein YaeQ